MADQYQSSTAAVTETLSQQQPESHTIQLQRDGQEASPHDPPPPPVPSSDPRLCHAQGKQSPIAQDEHDLFKLAPVEALRLLSASVELLVRLTGDIPPTPPPKTPTNPQMSDMQAEKANIVRSHSEKSLLRLKQQTEREDAARLGGRTSGDKHDSNTNNHNSNPGASNERQASHAATNSLRNHHNHSDSTPPDQSIDGVRLKQGPPRFSPPAIEPHPYLIIGADSQPLNLQHGAITRKFYSKNEPPISINQYLLRLHQFCPMSTAVYLATSLYIHRLAVEEKAIPVTRRNAHRLVLAGLRVAMKALEDLSYPHGKIAKVGGVSEVELARLEISFCFLAGFELVVREDTLKRHWEELRGGKAQLALKGLEVPALHLDRRPRGVPPPGG